MPIFAIRVLIMLLSLATIYERVDIFVTTKSGPYEYVKFFEPLPVNPSALVALTSAL